MISDDKAAYMASMLKSVSSKGKEAYIIARIWSLLDDDRIKFVAQKSFQINGKIYLVDLFLPQIYLAIEVYEEQHLKTIAQDKFRIKEIESILPNKVEIIDFCSTSTISVDGQIQKVVAKIKELVAQQGTNLKPWLGDYELTAEYHRKKEYLSVLEEDCVKNNAEAFRLFGIKPQQRAGAKIPYLRNIEVWLPNQESKEWKNTLSDNDCTIEMEYVGSDLNARAKYDESLTTTKSDEQLKITFVKGDKNLYKNVARFVGVFRHDNTESKKRGHHVYRRISYYIDLRNLFIYENYI